MTPSIRKPEALYHLVAAKHLDRIRRGDIYAPDSLVNEGFIHLAYRQQLVAIIKKYHSGAEDIYLLQLDPTKLHHKVIAEAGSGDTLYPHLYGPLNTEAVCQICKLTIDPKGEYTSTQLQVAYGRL